MGSWLEDHIEFNKNNESPDYFHVWAGLFAIACQLGRRVWITQGYRAVFPNMYVCLVAPSAIVRKGPPRDIVAQMMTDARTNAIFVPQRLSSTAMLIHKMLQGVHAQKVDEELITLTKPTIICADELASVLNGMTLNDGITDVLNSCYTCPSHYDYSTFSRNDEIIPEPCLNILGCTTPVWLKRNLKKEVMDEGLFGRFVWMYQSQRKQKIARPSVDTDMLKLRQTLVARLMVYQQLSGEMVLSDTGGALFDHWYDTIEPGESPTHDAFIGRIHEHVLKVAMCLCVGDGQFPVITDHHIAKSINLVNLVLANLGDVTNEFIEEGETGIRELVIHTIIKFGTSVDGGWQCDHSVLVNRIWRKPGVTMAGLSAALAYLEMEAKMLTKLKGGARGKKIWRLEKNYMPKEA